MAKKRPRPAAPNRTRALAQTRASIIDTVKTPLGFFVLVVLVVDAIVGAIAAGIQLPERTYIVAAMFAMLFLLITIVSVFAYYRPEALLGHRPVPVAAPIEPAPQAGAAVVRNPRILCAATPDFEAPSFEQDIAAIRDAFPDTVTVS